MLIPGIQVKSEDESLEASKKSRDLFAPYEQDLYMVSHSPDGTSLHKLVSIPLHSSSFTSFGLF